MKSTSDTGATDVAPERRDLWSVSFLALLAVQFLGVADDALLRVMVLSALEVIFRPDQQALSVALPAFLLLVPWIVLSPVAGWLANRFSKQRIVTACKVVELLCMAGLVAALDARSAAALCVVTIVFAAQLGLCNPSKLGAIPDLVRPDRIPAANAAIALAMVLALIAGTWYAGTLFDLTFPKADGARSLDDAHWGPLVAVFSAISIVGLGASLAIRRLPAAKPGAKLAWNFLGTMISDLRTLRTSRQMTRVVVTYAFYWALGAGVVQLSVFTYGKEVMHLDKTQTTPLLGMIAVGAGIGSVFAGIVSAGIIELGLVPVAGVLFSVGCMALYWTHQSYAATMAALFAIGFAGGMVNVPLYSYLQYRSPQAIRGTVLAANNFVVFLGMVAATGFYYLALAPGIFVREPVLSVRSVLLTVGLISLPVGIYGFTQAPLEVIRFAVGCILRTFYKIRPYGRVNLPEQGGALLVCNHISWIDGLLIGITCPRAPRMVAYAEYVQSGFAGWFSRIAGIIPITPGSRQAVHAVREAREALRNGEFVCVFAEGCLSRTGQLLQFLPGFLKILKDTGVPVVPVYVDGLWGSIFSYSEGRFFWKRPKAWRPPIGVHYGRPIQEVEVVAPVRRAVETLGIEAAEKRKSATMILTRRFLRECRRSRGRSKVSDSTGGELTGGTLLLRTIILKRLLERHVLAADEKHVGVLLPPSAGAVVVNAALAVARRTSVNLNYTVTSEVMNACIRQAGIKHVLTSRRVMEKFELKLDAELVYLEDFKEKVTLADKLTAAFQAYVLPIFVLERLFKLTSIGPDDILTVIFTSGSTGEPKGVMLSFENVGSNVAAIDQIVHLRRDDVIAGILPFFHSFGYTVTLWTVLTLAPKGAYHFSPLDARQISELCGKHGVTILLATPTFLRSYLRRCSKEDFAKLDVVVAGAEKLPVDLCDAFEKQFGVRPVEGYGCTELSPLVSVNVPPSRAPVQDQSVVKEGTVGRTVPGVAAKITDLDTGVELDAEQNGMLWIKGPNVMRGYMNQPEKTAQVIRDGWYMTGDVALIDKDGFIKITGRESRFSKIGGEMVPHVRIEEELSRIVGGGDEEQIKAVVTAVPDAKRGERLVVLHTALSKPPEAVVKELQAAGLPNLWIPSADCFLQVEQIPVLGTGKLDLRAIRETAAKLMPN